MKTTKRLLITLIILLAGVPTTYSMEKPTYNEVNKKNYKPKKADVLKKLRMQKQKPVVRNFPAMQKTYLSYLHKKLNQPNFNEMRELRDKNIDNLIEKKKTKKPTKVQRQLSSQELLILEPMEKEITNLIPSVQIESRSSLLENSEKVTIKIVTDLIENRLNDSTPEVTVENRSMLAENAAALQTSPLVESSSSISDSQLEDFPIPNNLIKQATNDPNNNAIATDKLEINTDASSIINSSNSENNEKPNNPHKVQNQLPSKNRTEQIVKIAPLLVEKFNKDNAQPILLAKQLTQDEIIEMTRKKIDAFPHVIDTTYVEIFDKFITSTQKLPEPKTSSALEFYYNRFFVTNQQRDIFEIEQFADTCERTVQSLFSQIKQDLHKITDQTKRNELINYFKQNKNRWSMNSYFTEKSLNALMHDSKHQTSQELDNIAIKNGDYKTQVTPKLYAKITALTDECTNNMQFFGNTLYDKSNLSFEQKYRIEKARAEKYKLPELVKTATKISSTISTWMITQLY